MKKEAFIGAILLAVWIMIHMASNRAFQQLWSSARDHLSLATASSQVAYHNLGNPIPDDRLRNIHDVKLHSSRTSATRFNTTNVLSKGPLSSVTLTDNQNDPSSVNLPIRAAFYYPWFPEAWTQLSIYPYTNYTPSLGFYNQSDQAIIQQHISAMIYGHINAGIISWWGQGTNTDNRIPTILSATVGSPFKWSIYYEVEGTANPDVGTLSADLVYLRDHYSSNPGYLRINDRFVIFVYADAGDGCGMVDRWKQANSVNAYIVLKVFSGYMTCSNQPDGWHQYAPAVPADSQGQYSYSISPGFWKVGEAQRLDRNITEWRDDIRAMIASGADFQLLTTFNEWGEGTAIESASEWASPSGFGAYLDALHDNGAAYSIFLPILQNNSVDPVIVGAGDIADCDLTGDAKTASLLDSIGGTVITLGDNAYESGTTAEFMDCYDPTWGRQKTRTRPSLGNHDYRTTDATGYFSYFGTAAGDPQKGYYSYNLGAWHVVVINSNCSEVGGCSSGSAQLEWLQNDLASHPSQCTLAYWHTPLFSSGVHGNNTSMQPIWQVLYDADADLVLNGHDHNYERFAPQNPVGAADPVRGIREFVVGTGGKDLRTIGSLINNSESHNDNTWGVLKLTLHPTSYEWKFIPVAGMTFTDSGSGTCH